LFVIRAVAFVPYPIGTTPSQRFRLEQWTPLLEVQGVSMTLRPFASAGLVKLLYRRGHCGRSFSSGGRCWHSQSGFQKLESSR
jgi:hypothetical protein